MHNTQTTDKDTGHLSQEKDQSMHNTQTADNDPGHLSQEKDKSTDHLQDTGHFHKRSTNPDTTQGPLTPQRVAVQSSPASAQPWCPSAPRPLSSASLRSCCQRSGGTPRGKPAGARPARCCRRRMDAASGDVEEKKEIKKGLDFSMTLSMGKWHLFQRNFELQHSPHLSPPPPSPSTGMCYTLGFCNRSYFCFFFSPIILQYIPLQSDMPTWGARSKNSTLDKTFHHTHRLPICGSPSKNSAGDNTFHHTYHLPICGSPSKNSAGDNTFHHTHHLPICGSPSKNNALDKTFHHTHHQSTSGSPSKMGALSSPSLLRRVTKTGLFVPKPSSVGDMPWAWLPGDTCATQTTNIPSAGERKETEGTLLPEKWGQHFFLLWAAASLNKGVQEVGGWGWGSGVGSGGHWIWHTTGAGSNPWCSKGYIFLSQLSVQALLWHSDTFPACSCRHITWYISTCTHITWYISSYTHISWYISSCTHITWYISSCTHISCTHITWYISSCTHISWYISSCTYITWYISSCTHISCTHITWYISSCTPDTFPAVHTSADTFPAVHTSPDTFPAVHTSAVHTSPDTFPAVHTWPDTFPAVHISAVHTLPVTFPAYLASWRLCWPSSTGRPWGGSARSE